MSTQMEVKYINPFITSIHNTMETMVGITPERMPPYVKDHNRVQGDISGIIGFADKNITGSVALSFPTAAALKIYHLMMGEIATRLSSDVQDIVGELANIVVGGAKKEFSEMGLSFHISIPFVVLGRDHIISHKFGTPVVVVPFKIGDDTFSMEITMKVMKH